MTDNVNHPNRYNHGGIETIDVIQGAMTAEEFRGFLKGNIVKYISRADYKNGVEDLEKARWYLDKLTEAHNRAVDDTPYGMPLISLRDEED
ncbi:DUF3310 domain-containing protein [Lacticaseibacillus saniviri]|uniref:DUF3310 domain-containing protein n=1 Tax=Lacticaseibacillus saniviri TaxID=931533 RepID=UPI0006D09726|nr:DUF3310 domain-containing protein [Lacticaseibacillus saniviri]